MGEAKRKREQARKQQSQQLSRPPLKHSPADAVTVLQAANAFREYARPFCEKAAESFSPDEVRGVEDKDFGNVIASATNLAFAIELYMKALRILKELGPMRTHDLATLYAGLPKDLRRAIKVTYDDAQKKVDPSQPARAIGVVIVHKDALAQDRSLGILATDWSLRAVLERSRDLFRGWRYLYDQGEPGKVKRVYYEYQWLEAAADALRHHASLAVQELYTAGMTLNPE